MNYWAADMANDIPAPIIIKRLHADEQHRHGGAWKIALADMMTAMMAFFLVLWLISSTSSENLTAIADYFKPPNKIVGSGGDLVAIHRSSFGVFEAMFASGLDDPKRSDDSPPAPKPDENAAEQAATDERNFAKLEHLIKEMIVEDRSISSFLDQIVFARDEEGLRIEIVDQENFPMFAIGTSTPLPRAREILEKVAMAIRNLPNKIIVRGHTDSRSYKNNDLRNNWLLSSERSDSTRLVLEAFGIKPERFAKIEGYADTMPYVFDDPYDARNRRISVVLRYQALPK